MLDKPTAAEPIITVLSQKQLDERRKKIIDLYGTIDELREKDSNGTISPREATALEDLEGFDFLEHSH